MHPPPSMLKRWLNDLDVAQFREHFLHRTPLTHRGVAQQETVFFDWHVLNKVLGQKPDVLVIREGVRLHNCVPTDLTEARLLFKDGASLIVRRAENHDRALRSMMFGVLADLPGEATVELVVTPRGSTGQGWCLSTEDVFVVQTVGRKSYSLRRDDTTPAVKCVLSPGDWLYVPRGYSYSSKSIDDALAIGFSMMPEPAFVMPPNRAPRVATLQYA